MFRIENSKAPIAKHTTASAWELYTAIIYSSLQWASVKENITNDITLIVINIM